MSRTHTDADDLRQLRTAIGGVLGIPTTSVGVAMAPDWREGWIDLAELGIAGLCVPEDRGGAGFEVEAAVAAAQGLGAALHASPYAGVCASAYALAHGDVSDGHRVVPEILDGTRICAFGTLDAPTIRTDGRAVSGVARLVDGAPVADSLLLVMPSSRELLLVADARACTIEPLIVPFDVTRTCGDVTLDRVSAVRIGSPRSAPSLFRLLLAADALGGVQHMLDRTIEYAGERQAFGRAIGGFQAVQHRLVDHTVRVRGMTLLVGEAARALAVGAPDAQREGALAELTVSSGALHVLHDLLQLTGAIGFTWDHGLHLYERRAHHDARLAGNPRAAIRRLAELEGWA